MEDFYRVITYVLFSKETACPTSKYNMDNFFPCPPFSFFSNSSKNNNNRNYELLIVYWVSDNVLHA